jgi:hypothetical protein
VSNGEHAVPRFLYVISIGYIIHIISYLFPLQSGTMVSGAPLDCNMTSEVTETDAWPADNYVTTVEGVVVETKCFQYADLPKASIPFATFPFFLAYYIIE